jgi:hypothetical protein
VSNWHSDNSACTHNLYAGLPWLQVPLSPHLLAFLACDRCKIPSSPVQSPRSSAPCKPIGPVTWLGCLARVIRYCRFECWPRLGSASLEAPSGRVHCLSPAALTRACLRRPEQCRQPLTSECSRGSSGGLRHAWHVFSVLQQVRPCQAGLKA